MPFPTFAIIHFPFLLLQSFSLVLFLFYFCSYFNNPFITNSSRFTMVIYKFRITFEEYDDISRDIEIKSQQTFEDFHEAIQESIGFDNKGTASFYMSDDHWQQGQEITNADIPKNNPEEIVKMNKSRVCDFIITPHQKIYYVFDTETIWAFFIELVKISKDDNENTGYPRCVKKNNEAPKQYGVTVLGAVPVEEDEFSKTEIVLEEESDEELLGAEEPSEKTDKLDEFIPPDEEVISDEEEL